MPIRAELRRIRRCVALLRDEPLECAFALRRPRSARALLAMSSRRLTPMSDKQKGRERASRELSTWSEPFGELGPFRAQSPFARLFGDLWDERRHVIERSYGSFSRSFSLPANADAGRIAASFKDGVLTIDISKTQESKPKQVDIKGA
jgi:hypothetical protein